MQPVRPKGLLLFLLLLALTGFSPCQGVMLGGSVGLGIGGGAGGDGGSSSGSEDTTQFRPASLPPAVDEPSYSITASLSVTGSTATVSGTVRTTAGSIASGVNVTVVQFELSSASASESGLPALTIGGEGIKVTSVVESGSTCTTTDVNGQFTAPFSNHTANKIYDVTVGCRTGSGASDTAGGSADVRMSAQPTLTYTHTSSGANLSGATVTSISFLIKFSETMGESSITGSNVGIQCDSAGALTLTFTETTPDTDNIAKNEFSISATSPAATQSCTLTIRAGVTNTSGVALTNPTSVSFTFQSSGSEGSSGGSSGSSGSSTVSFTIQSVLNGSGTALSGSSMQTLSATANFSAAVDDTTINGNVSASCPTTVGTLRLLFSLSGSVLTITSTTITPTTDTSCTLAIGTGVKDTSGNSLSSSSLNQTTSFTLSATTLFGSVNTTLAGQNGGDGFGYSIALGDVTGDGRNDAIMGAPSYSLAVGRAYLYQSGSNGLFSNTFVGDRIVTIDTTGTANPQLGSSAVFYNNGGARFAVGSPLFFVGGSSKGVVEYYNSSGTVTNTLTGPYVGDLARSVYFGSVLAVTADSAGSRLVVGANDVRPVSTQAGSVFVYEGTTQVAEFTGDSVQGAEFGEAVAAGDFNGDGRWDIVGGSPAQSTVTNGTGKCFVYLGGASGYTASTTFIPPFSTGLFCRAIAAADVNGDGYDDLVVGAPGGGDVFVYHGSSSAFTGFSSGSSFGPSASTTLNTSNAGFGSYLAAADFNGDGYDDVVIGELPLSERGAAVGTAKVYLYLGSPTGLSSTLSFWSADLVSTDTSGRELISLAAGDVNADGKADILAGVPSPTSSSAGNVFIFLQQ